MPEIAIALDVPDRERALDLAGRLGVEDRLFKVGLELFSREGPVVIRELRERGARIFLDLKLHDIPTTVTRAVEAAADLGAAFLTVHATGGETMLKAAVEASDGRVDVLAVTILTSLGADEVETTWNRELRSLRDEVVRLAALAADAGADGVVGSTAEVAAVKRRLGGAFRVATPGIRLAGDETHDQTRVATPAEAVRAGADILVVGRTVTAAPEPREALRRVVAEARAAEDERTSEPTKAP